MDYFWMRMDYRIHNGIRFEPLTNEELSGFSPILKRFVLSNGKNETIMQDYLTTRTIRGQYHLISDSLKKLCSIYLPDIQDWTPCVFFDQYNKAHLYWFLTPRKLSNSISLKTVYNFDKTVNELVLIEDMIRNNSIFCVETELQRMIIIRLDVAESILRRNFYGIYLMKVRLEEG